MVRGKLQYLKVKREIILYLKRDKNSFLEGCGNHRVQIFLLNDEKWNNFRRNENIFFADSQTYQSPIFFYFSPRKQVECSVFVDISFIFLTFLYSQEC